ncbi:MAG: efflux RND transporter periplasmic adaptor subunit [Fulvivirga sp.]
MSTKNTILISIGILLVSAGVTAIVFSTEPEAQREGATKRTAMLVDVIEVEQGDFTPTVVATGTVQPARDIMLSPRVAGEVLSISDEFVPGSFVKKGTVLLQIDPADYKNNVQLRQSDLSLAEADLSIEMGRQDVAQQDYELVGSELSMENKELVLRKPQLQSAKANVASAEASLQQAKLDLQRTTIRAPFDAHIISRNANQGSQVQAGSTIGRLVGVDEYWVVANVPIAKINRLKFGADDSIRGSKVKITSESNWPSGQYREGHLYKLIGAVEDQTRLARILVRVDDPLATRAKNDTIPKLMIGTFVETNIEARPLKDVVRLSRDYLRKNETVWVMNEGKLQIRKVAILFQDAHYAYITSGLSKGDKVVTTNLSTVVEGSDLRTKSDA